MDDDRDPRLLVLGVDPAPGKGLCVWGPGGLEAPVPALQSREWLRGRTQGYAQVLVAWDAPVSFDSSLSLSDRPVDKAVRAFISEQVAKNMLHRGAVSVRPFSGCPHWTITCEVLGLPFSREGESAQVLAEPHGLANGLNVVEVHPAVTLAIWWLEANLGRPMPRYKQDEAACSRIAGALGLPLPEGELDDALDALVSQRMGTDFMAGRAIWVGSPLMGGYVLPRSALDRWQLGERVQQALRQVRDA